MRVGVLTTSFPRYEGDIAGNFVLGFARALSGRGHQVEVLAPEPACGSPAQFDELLTTRFVPYMRPRRCARTFYGPGVPDNLAKDPLAWLGLLPFAANLALQSARALPRWQALVSHWALPCALSTGWQRGERPHVVVFHSADLFALSHLPGRRTLASRIVQTSTHLWFVAPHLRQTFLELLPPRLRSRAARMSVVCPMGVDPQPSLEAERGTLRRNWDLDRFTVLCLGRLVPIKGLHLAIEALAGRQDIEVVVAGQGPEREALAKLAKRCRTRVRFVGKVVGEAKQELLVACDALALPSVRTATGRTEGLPTTLLEAMAHGLPVVAARTGGIEDWARHRDNALLHDAGDTASLSSALDELCMDRALRERLTASARRTVEPVYWRSLGPHIEGLLKPIRE